MAVSRKAAQDPAEVTEPQGMNAEETAQDITPEENGSAGLNEKDPWLETVTMIVPKKPKGDDQQYYICINDRRFLIPANGKMQELPQPVAEVLRNSLELEEEADEFAANIPNMSGEIR